MTSIPSRFQGIEIPVDDPFQNDSLGYNKYTPVLKGMVDMYKDTGCVIAINGRWGTGKTTFMKMWKASLSKEEYDTVYFNAWKTDYFADPLVAILGELRAISQDSSSFNELSSILGKILTAAGGAVLKGVLKKVTGIESVAVEEAIDEVKTSINGSLENYKEQKQSLDEFKKKLSEYVAGQGEKPVVFIIDELDRCNPYYAVRVLEIMKHFFDVPNICFFLIIDKKQLESSIKGFYGSSEIDADNYLRRFIDIEFRMPEPNLEGFTELLFKYYNYQDFFCSISEDSHHTPEDFRELVVSLSKLYRVDLRTLDKIMAYSRLTLIQLKNDAIILDIVLYLCFIRVSDSSFYEAITHHNYTMEELLVEFEKRFPREMIIQQEYGSSRGRLAHKMIYLIGPFLLLYNIREGSEIEEGYSGLNRESTLPIHCNIIDQEKLLESMKWFKRCANPNFGMDNVLKTVNLLRQFN